MPRAQRKKRSLDRQPRDRFSSGIERRRARQTLCAEAALNGQVAAQKVCAIIRVARSRFASETARCPADSRLFHTRKKAARAFEWLAPLSVSRRRSGALQRHASTITRLRICSLRWKKCSPPGITTTGNSCGRAQSYTELNRHGFVHFAVDHERVLRHLGHFPAARRRADEHHPLDRLPRVAQLLRHMRQHEGAERKAREHERHVGLARLLRACGRSRRAGRRARRCRCRARLAFAPTPRKFERYVM